MTDKEKLINYIKVELITGNTLNSAKLRWLDKETEVYSSIMKNTYYLDDKCKFTERLYHILNELDEIPKCICGKSLKFKSINSGYSKACLSHDCIRNNRSWKTCSATKIEKNIKLIDNFKTFILQNQEFLPYDDVLKYISGVLEKTDNGRKSHLLSNKDYEQNKNYLSSIIELTKNILPIDLSSVRTFANFCFSERFYIIINNIKHIGRCSCGKKKKYISFVSGYARACSNKCRIIDNTSQIFHSIENQGFKILESENIVNIGEQKIKIECLKCGKISEREMFNARWKKVYCAGCYGDMGISTQEKELFDYIYSLSSNIIQSYKLKNNTRKEIDVFDPINNVGFEYDGVYWHSTNYVEELNKFKYKHLSKTEECSKSGIKLYHIFSNEWFNDRTKNIWKSIINNLYGSNNRIFARKCITKEITRETSNLFLNENHLQGEDKSSIRYGLYYNEELVAVMTFCKSRFDKKYEYELSRYCNKLYINVVGGAGKLLNMFINKVNPKSIVTYANRRYSNGKLYETLGFKKIGNTAPNYYYFKSGDILHSRNSFQKHMLSSKLPSYDSNKTEFENMFMNGYKVIFDCGNIKYELKIS